MADQRSSSPLSSLPSSNPQPQPKERRAVRDLPFEIQQYVRIYFEESLFRRALDLLLSILSADLSSKGKAVTIPNSEHLALAATLVVHPWNTTRTKSEEKWDEAIAALRLLRILFETVGPRSARFTEAFKFRKFDSSPEDSESAIRHPLANEDSIWHRVDDLWAVVGWAFNCSCLPGMYAARWEHWQLWLEFMINVLEVDWETDSLPKQSVLWRYVTLNSSDHSQPRRFLRAIFADGSKTSLSEFREVFQRELKGPKDKSEKTKKREAVDIDNEIYGDYLAQDDSDNSSRDETRTTLRSSTRAPSARRITPRTSRQSLHSEHEDETPTSPAPTTATLGPPESINLRLRLMNLLVHISRQNSLIDTHPTGFPDPNDLFTLFIEFIKPLPLTTFDQMTSPTIVTAKTFNTEVYTTLLEFMLQRLLEHTTSTLEPLRPLTQDLLETQYLPFAANKSTIDLNARVSLCVEGLLRCMANNGSLVKRVGLVQAVEKGIVRRETKIKDRREKVKEGSEEEEALERLDGSSTRMRNVMKRLDG